MCVEGGGWRSDWGTGTDRAFEVNVKASEVVVCVSGRMRGRELC